MGVKLRCRTPQLSAGWVNSFGWRCRGVVLVVSALAKVTDQLMNVGWAAAEGRLDAARETLQLLRERHEA
jgi:aspartokinase